MGASGPAAGVAQVLIWGGLGVAMCSDTKTNPVNRIPVFWMGSQPKSTTAPSLTLSKGAQAGDPSQSLLGVRRQLSQSGEQRM